MVSGCRSRLHITAKVDGEKLVGSHFTKTLLSSFAGVVLGGFLQGQALAEIPEFATADYGMAARGSAAAGGFGIQGGRLLPCPSGTNPNCTSTSSLTPGNYASAWMSPLPTAQEGAIEIVDVLKRVLPEATLKESAALPNGEYYLRYVTPGPFGTDIFEFLFRNEGVERNWEGDSEGGLLVTYRSIGNAKYLFPLQTPISDFNAQQKRLAAVRAELGWRLVGCELLECYQ